MNNNELIERLRMCSKTGCECADEAIAALSPVLPEDVQNVVYRLREYFKYQVCREAVDLIERLARECEAKAVTIGKLAKRTEELEAEDEISHALLQDCKAQNQEYERALEKAEKEIDALLGDDAVNYDNVARTELERIRGKK